MRRCRREFYLGAAYDLSERHKLKAARLLVQAVWNGALGLATARTALRILLPPGLASWTANSAVEPGQTAADERSGRRRLGRACSLSHPLTRMNLPLDRPRLQRSPGVAGSSLTHDRPPRLDFPP